MKFRPCPICGASLDPGEKCDCTERLWSDEREPQEFSEILGAVGYDFVKLRKE